MIKLLISGSPCTHWSVARTDGTREVTASGIGWELFKNVLIARDKYRPDFFLYENNKSMSPAIREQITRELGVEPILINSALVSAQSRQRLYWVGRRNPDGTYSQIEIEQPADRGILLRDVLDAWICWREKAYTIDSNYYKTLGQQGFDKQSGRRKMVAERVEGQALSQKEMEYMLRETKDGRNHFDFDYFHDTNKDKSQCVTANMHKGVPYNVLCDQILVEPVNTTVDGKAQCLRATYYKDGIRNLIANDVDRKTCVAEPVRIGTIENDAKHKDFDSQQYRIYSPDGKSVTICGQGGGVGAKTGLYAVPVEFEASDGKIYPVYKVKDRLITIQDKQYPIKLADGYYIIRKLTVSECKRLQTVPDTYEFPVSATQAYKMLGNGWTCDVISHIMNHFDSITTEPIEVLSMYDGMSCGHIALDKLGANVIRYYATEIDKYAIKTTNHNYPDTIQLGDAFQVREDDWTLPTEPEFDGGEAQ